MANQTKNYRKFVATSVTAALVASAVAPAAFAAEKVDFKDSIPTWAKDAVDYLVGKGAIEGNPDGTFNQAGKLTRAQAAKILAISLGLKIDETAKTDFADAKDHWASSYIAAIQKEKPGVIDGYNGKFDPNANITRQQMAKMVVVAWDLKLDAGADISFSDNTGWGADQVNILASLGVVQGVEGGKFAPNADVTRGQAAVYVHRTEVESARVEVATKEAKVVSVTAVNGKQFEIKFSQAVDKATVLNGTALHTNVTVTGVDAAAQNPGALSAELSKDGKSLVITANAFFKGGYTVAVSDDVKTTDGKKLPKYASVVNVDDTTAPKFVSANAVAKEVTRDINVTFDEPVQSTGVIAYINGEAATVTLDTDLKTLKVQSATDIKAGTKVDVSLLNVKDAAGNLVNPNPLVTSVTVVADTVAPAISSVTVVEENKVLVTFSKDVKNDSDLQNAVSLLDGNGVRVGAFTFVKVQNDGKTVEYTAPSFTFGPNNTYTGTILIQDTVKDTLGNKVAGKYSNSVTFTKDTVAPVAQKAEYKNGKLLVTFSEEVAEVSTGYKLGLRVINKTTGVEVSVTGNVKVDANDKKVFELDQVIPAGSYELRLPSNLVKDNSVAQNKNAAGIFDFTVAAASTNDKTAPAFTYVATTSNLDITYTTVADGTAPDSEQVFSYTVQDNSGIEIATVRDLNNYTLNGKALPVGSYITSNYDATNVKAALTVNIYVPSNKIDKTNKDSVLVVSGVKDTAGNVANPQVSEKVAVYDGIAPEIKSVAISSGDKAVLVLELSEAVSNLDNAADFALKVNGVAVTVATVNQITAGTDKGKFYVTGTSITDFTNASSVTLELAEQTGSVVTDVQGNKAVFGKAFTVK